MANQMILLLNQMILLLIFFRSRSTISQPERSGQVTCEWNVDAFVEKYPLIKEACIVTAHVTSMQATPETRRISLDIRYPFKAGHLMHG